MTSGLPSRQFHELPPPADGFAAVRREARRRRRRKAAITSSTTAVLIVAAVAVAQASGATHSPDSLRVANEPSAPAASVEASAAAAPSTAASAGGSPTAVPSSSPQPSLAATPSQTAEGQVPAYRVPALRRTYIDRSTSTLNGGVTVCSGSAQSSGGDVQYSVDWCGSAVATKTSAGHDLTGEVCRDHTSDATLTYDSTEEVDLLVQNAAGNTVWSSSTGIAVSPDHHQLGVQADHCWDWTAPWTDVNQSGRALPKGTYELVVKQRASELSSAPDSTVSFTL